MARRRAEALAEEEEEEDGRRGREGANLMTGRRPTRAEGCVAGTRGREGGRRRRRRRRDYHDVDVDVVDGGGGEVSDASSSSLAKVAWLALGSRIATTLLTFLFDYLVRDLDSSAQLEWQECYGDGRSTAGTTWLDGLFGGHGGGGSRPRGSAFAAALGSSVVWDGVHFVRVCQCGYEFDHQIAFLPSWPLLMATFRSAVLEPALRSVGRGDALDRALGCALSGLLLSNLLFVASAVSLHRLAVKLGLGPSLAATACALYAFNPATVFYSSIYTESLYNFLHFESMVHLFEEKESLLGVLVSTGLLTVATSVRSNGILSCALVAAVRMRTTLRCLVRRFWDCGGRGSVVVEGGHSWLVRLAGQGLLAGVQCLAIVSPFYVYQISFQLGWCQAYKDEIGGGLSQQALEGELDAMGAGWCKGNPYVPKVYSSIQSSYWDVGLLKFYRLSQVPNFIMALPIWACTLFELRESLGWLLLDTPWADLPRALVTLLGDRQAFGQVALCLHWMLMLLVSVLIMNVQVSTRFLSTCSPLYLVTARLTQDKGKRTKVRWILNFFATYGILGCILFPNFYPFV
ncbi:GPI mannosyltransferase [Chloropicon primus]|uniref:GPI mannosyltransferase 2 n=1 Tax=Chloropicon primus TaxID=1764295 RepID=A0A5B8MJF2_9CHLO|nr:GPI mannosyltransferase [Chloropicon primus]|eukprot:QDZ19805.1 GPI mannosyltransferase [Chloropicon primus]